MADGATQGPASQAVADSRRLAQTVQRKRASVVRAPSFRSTSGRASESRGAAQQRASTGSTKEELPPVVGMVAFVDGHASDDVGGSSRVESQINLLSASLSSSWATSTAARPRSPVRRKRRMQPSQPRPRCTAPQQTERGRERVPVLLLLSLPGHAPTHCARAARRAAARAACAQSYIHIDSRVQTAIEDRTL